MKLVLLFSIFFFIVLHSLVLLLKFPFLTPLEEFFLCVRFSLLTYCFDPFYFVENILKQVLFLFLFFEERNLILSLVARSHQFLSPYKMMYFYVGGLQNSKNEVLIITM